VTGRRFATCCENWQILVLEAIRAIHWITYFATIIIYNLAEEMHFTIDDASCGLHSIERRSATDRAATPTSVWFCSIGKC
jgi:hypothetical protein